MCQYVTLEVNYLPADFLAIATQRLVNAKYRGRQILPRAYPAQRGELDSIMLPNWLSNCHAATLSNFGESLPRCIEGQTLSLMGQLMERKEC
jgi:hypothetical protein